jgi:predicted Zn-dependent protease
MIADKSFRLFQSVLIALTLFGCSSTYGEIDPPLSAEYLRYLTNRLTLNSSAGRRFGVTLLNTDTPIAYSPGGGELVLSRGIIRATRTEAELAFVIAHEMSHDMLGHVAQVQHHFPTQEGSAERKSLEVVADRHALQLLILAGFDPRASAQGLFNVYEAAGLSSRNSTHPEVEERVRIMLADVLRSRWRPPGTVDRREFQKFRREVARY